VYTYRGGITGYHQQACSTKSVALFPADTSMAFLVTPLMGSLWRGALSPEQTFEVTYNGLTSTLPPDRSAEGPLVVRPGQAKSSSVRLRI
jgi:hypothetical protein